MNREKEIKSTITGAYEFKDEGGVIYKMKILGRGEELFFKKEMMLLSAIYRPDSGNKKKHYDHAIRIIHNKKTFQGLY